MSSALYRSELFFTSSSLKRTMMSPRVMSPRSVSLIVPTIPALAAGPPSGTPSTSTPAFLPFSPMSCCSAPSGASTSPSTGRVTLPNCMICSTMPLTLSTGSANPTPADAPEGEYIAVLTPMSRPLLSSSGPPELPGLMAASVCTTSRMRRPVMDFMSRPTPETMPAVSVWSNPKGLPMANTFWPTRRFWVVPTAMGLSERFHASEKASVGVASARPFPPFTSFSTARSLSASYPTSLASYVLPSLMVTLAL
mmetsp:Transcript_1930/g.7500  ORF Transcript_1930/g.7500 Transcript_1930/m.7500 type:complete len:252 (+) Transcript_1930:185-940(+)